MLLLYLLCFFSPFSGDHQNISVVVLTFKLSVHLPFRCHITQCA